MFAHDIADSGAEGDEENLRAFAAGELHRGNKIGVAGDEDDDVGLFFQCQRGDVQSEPHVHAFLVKSRGELPGFEGDFAVDGFGDGAAHFAAAGAGAQFAQPQRNKRQAGELHMKRLLAGGGRFQGRRVVIVDAMKPMSAQRPMPAQLGDQGAKMSGGCGIVLRSQLPLGEAAVNQNSVGERAGNRTGHWKKNSRA